MRAVLLTLAAFLLSIFFINSCDESSPTGPGGGMTENHFPNTIGVLWKYQVYDSLTETTDTVWFSITDTATPGAGEFVTERREKRLVADYFGWQYLHLKRDTLEFFDDTAGVPANERIVFPLELGSGWTGPDHRIGSSDSSSVTLVGQITVPVATFRNGARIDRAWHMDFEGGGNWSQTWVVPDVGIVYRYFRNQYSDGANIHVTRNETWELIEYELSTFGLHQFPNSIGTEWVYERVDTVSMGMDTFFVHYDTVTVTIVDRGQFESGESYTLWEFDVTNGGVYTQYVVSGEERLSFQSDSLFNQLWDVYYNFPLAVGRTWGIDFIVPVPEVRDKEPINSPFQNFETGFRVRTIGGALNDYWTQEDWLVPEIGIVKSRRTRFGIWPELNRTWTLIDYQAPD
ncbi:MAG: hypothetical protein V3S17_02710 [candidate division Zixibacteria bacterium]